ncbi:hypothetical protein VNI00_004545 [Paramarasmius palmivorus]|uniref:NAD(P)-binding protein n=1 Tax=Paramarasmius palmivorus TaxID=297713 RepID=A0AAW0DFG3_9AGAR
MSSETQSKQLVWIITGTSTGLGRELTLAALERGDKVIATARNRSLSQLEDLKEKGADILELDVTAPLNDLKAIAQEAVAIHGRIDVVVNNAGYILVGAIEENTPEETYNQFNTNVFGALNVTRAFLPHMRERRTGTIVWMGSLGGWTSSATAGLYCTTKWALRGISSTLHEEISPLGLRSTCIDFGYFRTSFLSSGHRAAYEPRIADYKEITTQAEDALQAYNSKQPGDPRRGVQVVVDVVRGEGLAQGKPFPTSLQLGSDCYSVAKEECEKALQVLETWKEVSQSTDFC